MTEVSHQSERVVGAIYTAREVKRNRFGGKMINSILDMQNL